MILRNDNDDPRSDEVQMRWNGGKRKRERKNERKRKSGGEEGLDEYKRYAYTNVNMHVEFAMS